MTPQHAPPRAGLGDALGRLLGEARQLVSDYTLLAVLDARRAAIQFAWLLSSGLMAAVLLVTAWLALVVAGLGWVFGGKTSWAAPPVLWGLLQAAGAGAPPWGGRRPLRRVAFTPP